MRYWISRTPGEVEGPFDTTELHAMRANGSLTPESQVCAEGTETWQQLQTIPGFGDTPTATTPPIEPQPVTADFQEMSGRYSFSGAFGLGWKLFTTRYGIVLGVTLFALLANLIPSFCTSPLGLFTQGSQQAANQAVIFSIVSNLFSWAWSLCVATPISIGAIWVVICIGREQRNTSFSDIWTPFHNYGMVILMQLLMLVCGIGIALIAGVIGGIPGVATGFIIASVSDAATGVLVGALVGGIIFALVAYYLFVRIMLTYILIIDPEVGKPNAADALVSSWNRTKPYGWSLFGLLIVISLITGLSFVACFLPGLFFGYPLLTAVCAGAYLLLIPYKTDSRCRECGYIRVAGATGNCPECGTPWDEPASHGGGTVFDDDGGASIPTD